MGDTITLTGNADGAKLEITMTKVAPTTKATDQFSTPQSGNRFMAVQFRIRNAGKVAYNDSPTNGAKVSDASGQQFDPTIVERVAAGPVLPASVKIAPGGTALGYIVFEVPKAAKIKSVQFGTDSGFGETGEWRIG